MNYSKQSVRPFSPVASLAALVLLAVLGQGCAEDLEPIHGSELANYDRAEVVIKDIDPMRAFWFLITGAGDARIINAWSESMLQKPLATLRCERGELIVSSANDETGAIIPPTSQISGRYNYASGEGVVEARMACMIRLADGSYHVALREKAK